MSNSRRSYRSYQIIDHHSPPPPPFPFPKTLNPFFPSSHDDLTTALDNLFLNPTPTPPFSFPSPLFDTVTDVIQIETTPFCSSYNRLVRRVNPSELYIRELTDRVTSLESKFDRLLEAKKAEKKKKVEKEKEKEKEKEVDRAYTWTAEIKGGEADRKYKWTAEIEGKKKGERKYEWVTEINGKGKGDEEKRIYTWKAAIGGEKDKEKVKKVEKKKKKDGEKVTRFVEIEEEEEEPVDQHRSLVLKKAFAKRAVAAKDKGKKKDLSPQDAAVMIQRTFRAYLIHRSKALRALRELAIAKTKLKELRTLFHNFSYRTRISRDAEERQKFSERIIVLLLTVDAIEGVDLMVRAAKRSMVDELEAMLDVVDPQPAGGRSLSMRRRTFDMPTGGLQKEIAEGVAQVVQMIEEENGTFEACL